jgi:hypothetical protein
MGFYMETFEASVQSGELPVNYSDHAAIYSILRYSMITSHMQKIIQIYPYLLKLSRKQNTILKIGDFSTKN